MESDKKNENEEKSENIINSSTKSENIINSSMKKEIINTTSEKPKKGRKKIEHYIKNILRNKSRYINNRKILKEKNKSNNLNNQEKNKIKILDTVLLGFLIFLESFILNIGYDLFNNKFRYSFMTIYILFLIILQKYILDNKIYRYQMASFLLFL